MPQYLQCYYFQRILIIIYYQSRKRVVCNLTLHAHFDNVHEMMSFHSILECLRYFVGKGGECLVFCEVELHLLILEELAESRGFEEVNQDEGTFTEFDIVTISLNSFFNLRYDFMVGVFARTQSQFIFLVLVTIVDVNYTQSHRQRR